MHDTCYRKRLCEDNHIFRFQHTNSVNARGCYNGKTKLAMETLFRNTRQDLHGMQAHMLIPWSTCQESDEAV